MPKDCYQISKESLNLLLHYAGEMFEVGMFIADEHKQECNSIRSEVLCDGVWWKLDSNYKKIYRLINVICNDDKLDGEID